MIFNPGCASNRPEPVSRKACTAESLVDAARNWLGAFPSKLLSERCQLLDPLAEHLELLFGLLGVRRPQLNKIGRSLRGREVASKLEDCLGFRLSHVDHL
jgi:hypothetical protein